MAEESKTFDELLTAFEDFVPDLDDFVENIIDKNPEVVEWVPIPQGTPAIQSFMLGRIVAIGIMEFMGKAFGRESTYIPADPKE